MAMKSFVRYFPVPKKPNITVTFSCGCVKKFRSDKHRDAYVCEEHEPKTNFGWESSHGFIVSKTIERKYKVKKVVYWSCDICDFTGSDYDDDETIKCPNCDRDED
jgi:rubrerythrin